MFTVKKLIRQTYITSKFIPGQNNTVGGIIIEII
jgi:O-acetylhomoserine/O-acetylserine sulfhydrylase-like pyridoxal-dependent enzyme